MLHRTAVALSLLLASCGGDALADRATDPSDEQLLAAYPNGEIFQSIDELEVQVDCPVPGFLFGDGRQVALGVSVPLDETSADGGTPVHRWGLWRYYHLPSGVIGDRSTWGHLAQRGEFRDGQRVGEWTFWYPDGAKRAQGAFVDGAMDGQWQVWTSDGGIDVEHSGVYRAGSKVN